MGHLVETEDALLLAHFSQMYRSAVDSYVDTVGTFRGQSLLLCTIVKQDGMTQSEIADALAVQGATVTNMLKRLEESNLVLRRRDPDDNRLVRVYITDEGRELQAAVHEQLSSLEESVLQGISPADRATLRRLLCQIIDNIEDP